MKEKLYKILNEIAPYEDVEDETELFEEEILDSLTLIFFINEIEECFDIIIPEEEIKPENFSCISNIVTVLTKLMNKCEGTE